MFTAASFILAEARDETTGLALQWGNGKFNGTFPRWNIAWPLRMVHKKAELQGDACEKRERQTPTFERSVICHRVTMYLDKGRQGTSK